MVWAEFVNSYGDRYLANFSAKLFPIEELAFAIFCVDKGGDIALDRLSKIATTDRSLITIDCHIIRLFPLDLT